MTCGLDWRARTLGTGALVLLIGLAGWGAAGHRAITLTALDQLPSAAPDWLREESTRRQIAFQSNEPDRWRGVGTKIMKQENNPNHYLDAEYLPEGMTLETMPELRYEFVARLVEARIATEGEGDRIEFDSEKVGLLPYAIAEHYAKLVSSFSTLRVLEAIDDPARADQLAAARANAIREMGQLSHFVADAAQPLHTTMHFNGWRGDNPEGFTTSQGFHADIDSRVVEHHALNVEGLRPYKRTVPTVAPHDAFAAGLALIRRAHDQVTPLYELERDGDLYGQAGKAFIGERMADGASTLAGLYWSAWLAAEPTPSAIADFKRYNSFREEEHWDADGP